MTVSADSGFKLAHETGAPLELCKFALERAGKDSQKATALIQRWRAPQQTATTSNSSVCSCFDKDANAGCIVLASCTDKSFADNYEFFELVSGVAHEVAASGNHNAGPTIAKLKHQHGFDIEIRFERYVKTSPLSLVTTYVHRDSIAAMVETEVTNTKAFEDRAFRVWSLRLAMHVAAFNPQAMVKEQIPQNIRDMIVPRMEQSLYQDQVPPLRWQFALEGKWSKWAEQNSLLSQIWISSEKSTVVDIIKATGSKIESDIRVNRFARFATQESA